VYPRWELILIAVLVLAVAAGFAYFIWRGFVDTRIERRD
jgi:hypothetical protein